MPELAEVEFYRTQWNVGLGQKITRVHLHPKKRILRGVDTVALEKKVTGAKFTASEGHGKKMLFRFSGDVWLGLHLGMTGKLEVEGAKFIPGPHDHLVLFQAQRALVFNDPRMFGRVQFHHGKQPPAWWSELPPQPQDAAFTRALVEKFFARRRKVPIKAALLMQDAFPGIGNWMADEILWRARLDPQRRVESLKPIEVALVWKQTRWVSRQALIHTAPAYGDVPKNWFFHERWGRKGKCPRDGSPLERAEVGGRTTAWCAVCQK